MSFNVEEIKSNVQRVLAYSQEYPEPKVDKLINRWLEAKKPFIDALGGELIKEMGNVSFTLSDKEKNKRVDSFINDLEYRHSDLAWFIYLNRKNFYDNTVSKEYTLDTGDTIPKGMKLLKSFKYFITDKDELNRLQTRASMMIQEDKVEGILCFSIHPLDYLSVSENTYNWRSCHALDGEYRSGNLSYMCDGSTVVCYLRSKDAETQLPRFPSDILWNSKKWRMLMFMSESWQSMFAGRQYPFTANEALEVVGPAFREAFGISSTNWTKWYNDMLYDYTTQEDKHRTTRRTVVLGQKYYDLEDLVTDGKGSRHFNDLTHSSCYIPFYSWRKYNNLGSNSNYSSGIGEHYTIGAAAPCIACGEGDIASTEFMYCNECYADYLNDTDNTASCVCCGIRDYSENMRYECEEWYCEDCFAKEFVCCSKCDNYTYRNDAYFNRQNGNWYCVDCMEGRIF